MMKNRNILISGAGIAGLTVAYFLKEYGFNPLVIEKSDALRDNGYMIDFFSSGLYVSERMGIIDELRRKDHQSTIIRQFSEKNKKSLSLNISGFRNALKGRLFNFLRTDLVEVLYNRVKEKVEVRFSTSISSVSQDQDGVHVVYENDQSEKFDLLIGADGIHSNVRNLTYQANEVEKYYLGYYVAGLDHKVPLGIRKGEVLSMLAPKHQIMTYTTGSGTSTSLFIFQSERHKHLQTNEKVEVLKEEFRDFVSPVPEILDEAANLNHLYFDEVSQIKIAGRWNKNRIVLLGDAAHCITLLSGQGASMAMTGAYILAEKLSKAQGDYTKAFLDYETDLRPLIESMQKKAVANAASYLPASRFKLWIRNLLAPIVFTRLFSPLVIKQLGAENYFAKEQAG